eukprot:GHRR01021699.1.p1 GENE.GHRR01021699.1~~GHRR01021699.1.p1  ORF type:complete len:536 (+),score=232.58 GHRR01021699.1:130-1737(+)
MIMPVSLERLIAEVEPAVVTDELIRDCIVVTGTDPELTAEKKQTISFNQVECAAFSFHNLARIDNLRGLNKLVKLQLDNNHIKKIENLDHLTNLKWLDLSFNNISTIEGLDKLTQLQDLSLFNNEISTIQGLDNLPSLNVLSLGNNGIARLDQLSSLVRFTRLHLLNLAGNPMCKDPDYKSYVLSHLKNLSYLDYRRVQNADRAAAMEQHQDEMLELQDRQEAAATEAAAAADKAAHALAMAEANLDGVESLLEDMIAADPEWPKLAAVPGLLEPWNDVRDKWQVATEEFKLVILDAHGRKKAEQAQFQAAVSAAMSERDAAARALLVEYEKAKKQTVRRVAEQPAETEEQVLGIKVKLMALQGALLGLEMDAVEVVTDLVTEFDRSYSEMAEANKLQYNAYFTQVRDLENNFFMALNGVVPSYLERYSSAADNPELEALADDVQLMLGDKDALLNALQSSHECHTSQIDTLEDKLVGREMSKANNLADMNNAWQEQRHRDRMSEILSFLERNMNELDVMASDAAEAAADVADMQ